MQHGRRRLSPHLVALGVAVGQVVIVVPGVASAQESTPVPSDTATALTIEPARTLRFSTDEGTWISVDVSPDGRRIVFDLLGDLYTLPIEGGQAVRLTRGMAIDGMPRWSPDGSVIAFVSDRNGTDNLWVVSPDGTGLRRVTNEVENTLSSPEWTPDGAYLVVRRFGPYPTAENYLTNVPIWMYHVNGGSGVRLYPAAPDAKSTNTGVAFSPDGRTMYVASHGGGYSGENLGAYQIRAFDRRTGDETVLTAGAGGGLRPIASPDGRWLVYATRAGNGTALRIRDLTTQEDEWLVAETQRDDQEGYAPNDVFPGYAFTPDSRSVVFHGGGKIKRVDVATKNVSVIPFNTDVELGMGERLFLPIEVSDGPLEVTQLISTTEAPDGSGLAFAAVGSLWTASRSASGIGSPRRLTRDDVRQHYPAYSPDGRWIAYVTWTDVGGGYLWKVRSDGSGEPVRLTQEAGYLRWPTWSPDGTRIVYGWASRRSGLGGGPVAPMGELRWISSNGGGAGTLGGAAAPPARGTRGGAG